MDVVGKDANASVEGSNPVNYHESSDWQVNGNNPANASLGMISMCNSMVGDSFGAPVWDHPINGGYDATTSSNLGSVRADLGYGMLRGGMFPTPASGMLPHFPADSGFIERAARFSCFSGGSVGEMMNPFSVPDPLSPYSRSLGVVVQGQHDVLGGNGSKLLHGMQSQSEASSLKQGTDKRSESFQQGVGVSSNESDEAECSGRGPQEEADCGTGESSGKGLGSKKRKRGGQNAQNDETPPRSTDTTKDMVEMKQNVDQNTTSNSKPGGKNGKQQGSQGSDQPKEEYIHVRARRGQATNSHSLAERVRREKISERMKFLQDLVPGCSKVTGKAVMLDEIINYVQSLQRQVEFLSMKLATVNPRLDFNIEGFLAKDMLQPRAGSGMPSSLGLLPDMTMPFPAQPGLIQSCLPAEALRRPISLQLPSGFKDPSSSQVSNVWEDELHNIVHMSFNSTAPGPLPPGHMKAEP